MQAKIAVSLQNIIAPIDERLYSSFIEHMGRAVYTGIYEPDHPGANAQGFRQDVIDLIRPLGLSYIRYPGGNFLSGYHWEDGIGHKAKRPVRADLAWSALEPNQVGTDDFADFCALAGTRPMMGVNLGTRGPKDAANLLEYCNFEKGTCWSDLRRANGHARPHDIKLWCLGNEMDGPWQICGKTAEEYGRIACETAKMMKWLDPAIELVACGSSYRAMPTFGDWERTVLRHCYEHIDYLSLHQYYQNNDGDLPSFLAKNWEMDAFIKEVAGICREIQHEKGLEKAVYLSFDEWNVWYHFQKEGRSAEKWIVGRPLEEERYDFSDALLVGSMLITLINNADSVKIACLAQLVNALGAIMTEPGGAAWAQTIYYPFLHASQYGRGTALCAQIDCPSYDCADRPAVPYLDCAAVENENGLTLFFVNKHQEKPLRCELDIESEKDWQQKQWWCMDGYAPDAANTAEASPVVPRRSGGTVRRQNSKLCFDLPPFSWNVIRLG